MSRKRTSNRRPKGSEDDMGSARSGGFGLPISTDDDVAADRRTVARIREAKVERLRLQVRAGAYTTNFDRLARRILPVIDL